MVVQEDLGVADLAVVVVAILVAAEPPESGKAH
jgi:hypothetical protein